jgi:uncharacterized membrane protein (DUF485 family)
MNGTAGEALQREVNPKEWDRIAEGREFKHLVSVKKVFIVPAFVLFFAQYIGMTLLVGFAPRVASIRVIGTINVAYLFALFQFAMGWVIAALYLFAATKFDALTEDILTKLDKGSGGS